AAAPGPHNMTDLHAAAYALAAALMALHSYLGRPREAARLSLSLTNSKGKAVTQINSGDSLNLVFAAHDKFGNETAVPGNLTFAVSDPAVLVLAGTTVTGEKAGTATLTVSAPNLTPATADVTVSPGPAATL